LRGHAAASSAPGPLLPGTFFEDTCFDAQQASEKALKAVHQHLDLPFRRTHLLGELLHALADVLALPEELWGAARLSQYGMEERYPDEADQPVTEQECRDAAALAEKVVLWAAAIIEGPAPASPVTEADDVPPALPPTPSAGSGAAVGASPTVHDDAPAALETPESKRPE